MRVLVACEYSGVVREAFARYGHDAWSCDLLETEIPGNHLRCDVRKVLNNSWDLMIAHPPCTHLAVSGSRWFAEKFDVQRSALDFVQTLMDAPIERIAIENPVSIISTMIRKPDQIINPYEFGHSVTKKTCLWLKNLPKLEPTNIVDKGNIVTFSTGRRMHEWYVNAKRFGNERGYYLSKTFDGIAEAMAMQWGSYPLTVQEVLNSCSHL